MSIPHLSGVELAGTADLPLLIVGPSLGTGVATLWGPTAVRLDDRFHVVGWNLPGHAGAPVGEPFTLAELAAGVRRFVAGVREARATRRPEALTEQYVIAGDSVGGAVGLQVLLEAPEEARAGALFCTGAQIGEPDGWTERAGGVRASGTPSMVAGSAQRWFAPDFLEREPILGTALLTDLQHAEAEGYAQACEALASYDVRARLAEVTQPVIVVAGALDVATPVAKGAEIADGVRDGRLEVFDNVAHLAPAEAPGRTAGVLRALLDRIGTGSGASERTEAATYDSGMTVRRAVLGDAHVDRATAGITEFTDEFQAMITRYAWGTIWTRQGLSRRERSIAVLTALIARGHHEELAMHVRSAITNGLSVDEIKEVILQSAIYCGVPDANTAFRIAQTTLRDLGALD